MVVQLCIPKCGCLPAKSDEETTNRTLSSRKLGHAEVRVNSR
jgi:hypothetical protein